MTEAEIVDWPGDQFEEVVAVTDFGPQNRELSGSTVIYFQNA